MGLPPLLASGGMVEAMDLLTPKFILSPILRCYPVMRKGGINSLFVQCCNFCDG